MLGVVLEHMEEMEGSLGSVGNRQTGEGHCMVLPTWSPHRDNFLSIRCLENAIHPNPLTFLIVTI